MKLQQVVLLLVVFLVSACGDSTENGNDPDVSNQMNSGGSSQRGDVLQVNISNQVSQSIEIISATSTKTGKTNPIEVRIVLKNTSNTPQQVLLDSKWLDARGGFNGGGQRVLKLAAGQSYTVQDGTRSPRVTQFKATLSATKKSQDQLLSEMLTDKTLPLAPGYGMTYSETPATEKIPNWSVRGVANGFPFDAKTMIFRPDSKDQWRLNIHDRELGSSKNLGIIRSDYPDVQSIYINLPEAPTAGKVFQQKMQYGGGMFQIKPKPSSKGTTSWNTSLAYKIEITEWPKKAVGRLSCGRPKAGKVAGRLYISFKGSEKSIKDSWVSGSFNDAVALYCDDS